MRRLNPRGERGQVLVIVALMLPVLLGFAALVTDLGSYYTLRRHLQTQADAAALASGSAWRIPCDSTVNTNMITQARNYAGPHVGSPGSQYNGQLRNPSSSDLHVLLNSQGFYGETGSGDFTDGADTAAAQPCQKDYLDVKVTQSNPPTLFGLLGNVVGSIKTQARVKIVPIVDDKGFLPFGIPVKKLEQVNAYFHDTCDSNSIIGKVALTELPGPQQTMLAQGVTLWKGTGSIAKPSSAAFCSGVDYRPIRTEVRVAGAGSTVVDLDSVGSCVKLKFVDCWSDLHEMRLWPTVPATNPPVQVGNVTLINAFGNPSDCANSLGQSPYFSSLAPCAFVATVDMNWGDRTGAGFSASMNIGGGPLVPTSAGVWDGPWVTSTSSVSSTTSPGNVQLSYSWSRNTGSWRGASCAPPNPPCSGNGTQTIHRTVTATTATAGIVRVITPSLTSQNWDSMAQSTQVTVTVGVESGLVKDQFAIIRAGRLPNGNPDPQGNQSLRCDPQYTPGDNVPMLALGCDTFYTANDLKPGTWEPCPDLNVFFQKVESSSYPQPFECTSTDPGFTAGQVADGMNIQTGNCTRTTPNNRPGDPDPKPPSGCNQTDCINPNLWVPNKTPGYTVDDPRVIQLFLVPYGALNEPTTVNGAKPIEVVGFVSFYVTGWSGNGPNTNPCYKPPYKDDFAEVGTVVGRFIKAVGSKTGTPNPNLNCNPDRVEELCAAVLVK